MWYALFIFFIATAPLAATTTTYAKRTHHHTRQEIHTDELKAWYDQNKPMVVVDSRSEKFFDGTLLPKAKWLPVDATQAQIQAALPSKNIPVVVYCAGPKCPLSGTLYDRLKSMGYTSVYEYRDGIRDWMKKGFPTDKQ